MKVTPQILLVAVLAAGVVMAGYLGQTFLTIQKQHVYNQAVEGCMNVSKFVYENKSQGTNSIMVVEDLYNKCLQIQKNGK